jgi:hypothetical protein
MKHTIVLALLGGLTAVPAARAQVPTPYRPPPLSPAYSPYLNLNRSGASAAQNYYGLVRPQIDARNAIGTLQQQVGTLDQVVSTQAAMAYDPNAVTTGHPVSFMNYGGYFAGLGGSRPSGRLAGGAAGGLAGVGATGSFGAASFGAGAGTTVPPRPAPRGPTARQQ